jgi:hypothetical protein
MIDLFFHFIQIMDIAEFLNLMFIFSKIRIVLILIGLVGNVLSLIIFSRKSFSHNSISIYCRALELIDLHHVLVLSRELYHAYFKSDVLVDSIFLCRGSIYLTLVATSPPGWLLSAFSFDNMICVSQIKHFYFMKKRTIQIAIVVAIILLHAIVYLIFPQKFELTTNRLSNNATLLVCDIFNMPNSDILVLFYLIDSTLLPFGFIVVTTIVIVYKLVGLRKKLETRSSRIMRERRYKDRKLAITSLAMNFIFLLLKSTISFGYFIDLDDYLLNRAFFSFTMLTFKLNYSLRFSIYFISNSIFRNEFYKLVRLKGGDKSKSSVSTQDT